MSFRDETAWLDATALADMVRRKEVTPNELVEAAIERIERINPEINAVVTPMYDLARAAARSPIPDGPFTGVPFLLKDLLAAFGGVRMTSGSAFLSDFVPEQDSELVKRFKQAGLIIVGKTNTPEFGILPTTEPALFGPSRNPWDITRTTGGSSGGSAAAVAAGLVPMAHANDGGGSIRIPASACGLFGLKPTRARISLAPDFGDMYSGLVCEHAVTRSVRDSAALLDAVSGFKDGDPYCAPPRNRPFSREIGVDPGKLRIAFTTKAPADVPVHEDCIAAVKDAALLCEQLGHSVVESSPKVDGDKLADAFAIIWSTGCAWTIDGLGHTSGREPTEERFEPGTWFLYQKGRERKASRYLAAVQHMQRVSRTIAEFLSGSDLLLTPTLAQPPLPIGSFDSTKENPVRGLKLSGNFSPFTALCNATGQPAMSVPLFWNEEGLPIGTQFIGRFGDEATLFRLASQLEGARPWSNRRPANDA